MRMRFHRHGHQESGERRRHMPLICIVLMGIGFMTVLYLMIVYVLMPVLAMLTVS